MVLCIMQDSVGFIWIGTSDGLNKYDGYSFTTYRYDRNDPHTLSNNLITAIEEDQEGRIWVGTEKGLNLYDRVNDRFIRYETNATDPLKPSISDIVCITCDKRGNLWIGSRNKGLNVLLADSGEFLRFRKNNGGKSGLAHDGITAISVDDDGSVWVMCWSKTISIFDWTSKKFRHLDIAIEYPGRVSGFIKPRENQYWFGTNKGLLKLDTATGEQRVSVHDRDDQRSLPANKIHSLFLDHLGRAWMATENGIALYTPGEAGFQVIQNNPADPRSISLNLVRDIIEDHTNTIWIGTRGKGLNIYSPTKYKFRHLTQIPNNANSLTGNYVYSILEDTDGYLWIGNYEGFLNRIDPANSHFEAYDFRELNHNTGVNTLLQWSDTEMLIGSSTGKVHLYDSKTGEFSTIIDTGDIVGDMLRSSMGELYLALRSRGLAIYDREPDGRFVLRTTYDNSAIYSPRLISLAESSNYIWIGSQQGLHRFEPSTGVFKTYNADGKKGSLLNDYIPYLTVLSDNTLWIGTRGGLSRYVPETDSFITYTRSEGLPNDVIYGILEDENNELWLGTNRGLVHWDPESGTVLKLYLQEDGLQSNEFNTGACYKSPSGTMYFGGVNGVSVFEPAKIEINSTPPPVVLTSFSIFGKQRLFDKPLSKLDRVDLTHDENYVGFEFAALDYISPSQNQYSYKLTGVDPDWVDAGNRNFVSYNLNPGIYSFQVRGSNSDGIWNEDGLKLEIVVHPPFWGTLWFRAVAIIVSILVVWGLFIVRTYSVRNQRDTLRKEVALRTKDLKNAVSELESFSYTVSHDIRAPLRNLQGFCELLSEDFGSELGEKGEHYVDRIIENAGRMEELIDDILWLSRAANNEIIQINFDLSAVAESVIADLKRNHPDRSVEVQIEKNIQVRGDKRLIRLAMENLIGNAWKFTKDNDQARIELSTSHENGKRTIKLADNGIGFDQKYEDKIFEPFQKLHTTDEYEGSGIGLSTVKKIITRHGGRIWAEGKEAHGSTFKFTLPEGNKKDI